MTRVLVFGSRDWTDQETIEIVLGGLVDRLPQGDTLVVIEGGAKGADAIAAEWATWYARDASIEHEQYPAEWERLGKAAGSRRNQRMLEQGRPDVVWGFITKPLHLSAGSADMARRCRAAGIPTYVVETRPAGGEH